MKEIVIIPAAGLATRLRPLSNSMSKAMVPVAGKPILGHILSSLNGLVDKVVVVSGQNSDISNFLSGKTYHFDVAEVKQDHEVADGPLGAIYAGLTALAHELSPEDRVTVWLGDTLMTDNEEIAKLFSNGSRRYHYNVVSAEVEDHSRWCLVDYDVEKMQVKYYDKPAMRPVTSTGKLRALIGVYQFIAADLLKYTRSIVEDSKPKQHLEISSLLNMFLHRTYITEVKSWLDCGDLPSLHHATAKLINDKSRAHNSVSIDGQVVTKKLQNDNERSWYESVQSNTAIKSIIPQYLGANEDGSFNLELCSGNTLQDMLVYDNIRPDCWKFIIDAVLSRYLCAVSKGKHESSSFDPHHMFNWNIRKRFSQIKNLSNEPIVFLNDSYKLLEEAGVDEYDVVHGDFHFGNILYDASCNKVKLIDPRGEWCGIKTTSGHVIYDLAKFYQSVFADYAWIVSGEAVNEDLRDEIVSYMDSCVTSYGFNVDVIKRYSIILLLSAVPCHYDNPPRQSRMIVTALDKISHF